MDLDNGTYEGHISKQFNEDLVELKSKLLSMGGLVERQVEEAVSALLTGDVQKAEAVETLDDEVDQLELELDEECTRVLARRQPAASDLRLIMAVTKMINDLERIGDEAEKIARITLRLSDEGEFQRGFVEVRHIGNHVTQMVHRALDAFARLNAEEALAVMKEDKLVDAEYKTAMRSLITFMMEDPRNISSVLNVMWVLRSLERIGDHARNVAEYIIYMVKGRDVRHTSLEMAQAAVRRD